MERYDWMIIYNSLCFEKKDLVFRINNSKNPTKQMALEKQAKKLSAVIAKVWELQL